MIQGEGVTLAQGQQRALEGRPQKREGPRGREGAKIEEREIQKETDRREAERERKANEKNGKNEEGKKFEKEERRGGRLRKGQKNKENKRKPKEQTLLFIYKNSPARLRGESAPRGGQGSGTGAAELEARAGAQPPSRSFRLDPAQNRTPS